MSKFVIYNDTGRSISIHPGSKISGVECDGSKIKPLEERVFCLPKATYPWVKIWDDKDQGLNILVQAKQVE
jgi:hypothetical protein